MKNNKTKKILIICLLSLCLTGCTQYAKNDDKKVLTNEETGQKIVSNVLCRPTDKDTLKIYKDNKISLKDVPECTEFSPIKTEYEGVWNSIFVKPLAWLIIKIGTIVKNYGIAIILITMLIRLILYPITKKSAMQSELMKDAQKDLDKLEKKYANKQSKEEVEQKAQEMRMIYGKHHINPLTSCLFALIQIPLFFAFYEALNRIPVVFEGRFLGMELGTSPLSGMSSGNFIYLSIIILVSLATYYSFKLNSATNSSDSVQAAQMKSMSNISIAMISIASFTISTSIGIYWIFNSIFTIIQNLLVKRRNKNA